MEAGPKKETSNKEMKVGAKGETKMGLDDWAYCWVLLNF